MSERGSVGLILLSRAPEPDLSRISFMLLGAWDLDKIKTLNFVEGLVGWLMAAFA